MSDLVDFQVGLSVSPAHITAACDYNEQFSVSLVDGNISWTPVRTNMKIRYIRVDSMDPDFWVAGWNSPNGIHNPILYVQEDGYLATVETILTKYFEETVTPSLLHTLQDPINGPFIKRRIPSLAVYDQVASYTHLVMPIRIPAWKVNIITLASLSV